ncbi:MAG TPA: type II secretion system protein [Solirubrobacterales bacterium]|nr:type II secretion system protein [Solirubrobacterales bacterium]
MRSAIQMFLGEESGLTLVELVIAMLVASILAMIAMPAFADESGKANDARAKQYAGTAMRTIETCHLESPFDTYTGCSANVLRGLEPTLPPNPDLKVSGLKEDAYKIVVRAGSASRTFQVKLSKGVLSFPCSAKGEGGCPANGIWATP